MPRQPRRVDLGGVFGSKRSCVPSQRDFPASHMAVGVNGIASAEDVGLAPSDDAHRDLAAPGFADALNRSG